MQRFVAADARPLVLDVGANEGQTVQRFKSTFPDCVIHSFEPGAETFVKLQEQTAHERNVFAWNYALGAEEGRLPFFENTNSDMSSFLKLGDDGWGSVHRQNEVEVMTVDRFLAKHHIKTVDVLKSDTQGYDLEVFKGADQAMRDGRIKLLFTELTFSNLYAGTPRFDELYRYVMDRGFRLVSIYEFTHQNDLAGWSDALFVHSKHLRPQA